MVTKNVSMIHSRKLTANDPRNDGTWKRNFRLEWRGTVLASSPLFWGCTWRIIPFFKWLITMVSCCPLSRAVGPLPNGLNGPKWLIKSYKWGLLTTYYLGWSSSRSRLFSGGTHPFFPSNMASLASMKQINCRKASTETDPQPDPRFPVWAFTKCWTMFRTWQASPQKPPQWKDGKQPKKKRWSAWIPGCERLGSQNNGLI